MPVKELIDKIPPQSIEAEIAVLGSMLIDKEAIGTAVELLNGSYFYKDAHRKIYNSLVKLYDKGSPVDIVTFTQELRNSDMLDAAGGPSYIASIASSIPTSANIEHYARIVREKAILRSLISTATQIVSQSYDQSASVDMLLDKAERMIFEISADKIEGKFSSIKDIIKSSIETIDNLYQRKENITGIATGFHDFDVLTAGLQKSDLVIMAGRPSMGKSALVSCIAEHVGVIEKVPLAFFSLEMSKSQLVQRMLCSHARVDAHKVRTGFLSQSDWPRLVNAAGKLSESPIYIDDTPSISALELRAKARRLKAQFDIGLIVVDYLQLMQGSSGVENRQQEISDISRSLKALARELNIPIIAVSQLSRAVEQRADRRPQLSDLRESGAIEQDADLVVLLLREEYYNPTDENKGIAEAIVAKQRNGPVGTLKLAFISEYTRFEDLAKGEEY